MEQVRVKEEYRGLSREQLWDRVDELARNYEINSYSCSQCTAKALQEVLGFDDVIVKAATSLCGGTAFQLVGTCGGLASGIMVLDHYFGRPADRMSDKEVIQENIEPLFVAQAVARELLNKYMQEYGTITCANIMGQLFGRLYYFEDPDEFKKFEEAGAHTDPQKCVRIVGNAARWVMEILMDRGVVQVP